MVEKNRRNSALLNFSLRWSQPNQVLRLFLKLFLVTPKVYNCCEYIAYFWIRKLKYFIVRLLLVLIIGCVFFSCGEENRDDEVEISTQVRIVKKHGIVTGVEDIDTLSLISRFWNSVYYIRGNDTIYSNKPFEIEFLNSTNNFLYKVNNQLDSNQTWKFANGILEVTGAENNYYYIVEISDSTFRTRDTLQGGFEYLFKAN